MNGDNKNSGPRMSHLRISILFFFWLTSSVLAQGTFDTLYNFNLMESSRCQGSGGDWSGMACSGNSANTRREIPAGEMRADIDDYAKQNLDALRCFISVSELAQLPTAIADATQYANVYDPTYIFVYAKTHPEKEPIYLFGPGFVSDSVEANTIISSGSQPNKAKCLLKLVMDGGNYQLIASGQPNLLIQGEVSWRVHGDYLDHFSAEWFGNPP